MNITSNSYLSPSPRPGPHVAVIHSAEDVAEREYLKLQLDIAEGPSTGFAKQREELYGNDWSYITAFVSYKSISRYYFNKFLRNLEESNSEQFCIVDCGDDLEPEMLVGLKIGVVLGAEEYVNRFNRVSTRLRVVEFVSVDDIHYGNLETPTPRLWRGGHGSL